MGISRYRLNALLWPSYRGWMSAWRLAMQWYVKLPENDKVAVLAFVQKGIYNTHIPSVAEDLYNIYLDESALAMWVGAQ